MKLIFKRCATMEYAPRYSRLAGEIASFEPWLQKRIVETQAVEEQWAIQSLTLLKQAKDYLKDYKIDESWKCFHAAKRLEIFGMEKDARYSLAKSLLKEAVKLSDWRKEAIFSLLSAKNDELSEVPEPAVLAHAAELKDECFDNQYYANRLLRSLFGLLFVLLFLDLGAIVVYFVTHLNLVSADRCHEISLISDLTGVLLFGILGALTSATLFARNLSKSSRMNEVSTSKILVISKIFIGAGFSVFIFLLLRSSVAAHIQLLSFSISSPLDYFSIAFVSGFTERLAQRSIDLIVGQQNPERERAPGSGTTGD